MEGAGESTQLGRSPQQAAELLSLARSLDADRGLSSLAEGRERRADGLGA